LSSRGREKPWIKPNWDALLFEQLDGLVGACIVRLEAFKEAARRNRKLTTSREDLDTLLRDMAATHRSDPPEHVPLVLTHRDPDNALRFGQQRSLTRALPAATDWPSVSVLLPTRDQPRLLAACLRSLRALSYRGHIEIIIVDNGSVDPEAIKIIES